MALVAAGLSGAVVSCALLMALLLARAGASNEAARWLALLLPVLAILELATGPLADALPDAARTVLALAATPNVALIWLFGQALFSDGFKPGRWHLAGAALLWIGPLLVWAGVHDGPAAWVASSLPFLMLAHLGWLALAGRADDLVPGRRQARLVAPALLLLSALVSLLSELLDDALLADLVRTAGSGLPAVLTLALWLLTANPAALAFAPARPAAPAPPAIDPRDRDLAGRLERAMVQDRLWQREGLTLDQLASHLGTPPHRVRALINAGLGHRNFLAYLNGFRIAAACAALADPARGRDTVLAIAFESGFASLATFNRVFRDIIGQSPSEFRAAALVASTN